MLSKLILSLLAALSASLAAIAGTPCVAAIAEGDLLFSATLQGNAITSVTQGKDGLLIDHVAIAHRIGGSTGPLYVIEAVPRRGVCLTPIDSFLARSTPQGLGAPLVIVGRVPQACGLASARNALRYVGRPYDYNFMPSDSAIYCSELVLKSVVDSCGKAVFKPIPMSFHDATGRITPYWEQHYARQGLSVPEGKPGSNPGELSQRPQVAIVCRPF